MSDVLHQKALDCVKNYKRSEAELLTILSEIDKRKSYLALGASSLFSYCVNHLKLSESETFRFTQVSRKMEVVPKLKDAILNGKLTVSKASRIAAVITQTTQDSWIAKAANLTHRELEREIAIEKPQAVLPERLKVLTVNRSELRITISAELEIKLLRAQEVLGTRTLEQTIEKMVDKTLQTKDLLRLAQRIKNQARTCKLKQSPLTLKKLTRRVPSEIRHEVYLRDQGRCAFKNCNDGKWIQLHHVKPYAIGGKHDVGNLMLICSAHHRMMHSQPKNQTLDSAKSTSIFKNQLLIQPSKTLTV